MSSDPPPTPPDASTRTRPPKFQGWRRKRGGRWWIVATGQTESECFANLLEAARPGRTDRGPTTTLSFRRANSPDPERNPQ